MCVCVNECVCDLCAAYRAASYRQNEQKRRSHMQTLKDVFGDALDARPMMIESTRHFVTHFRSGLELVFSHSSGGNDQNPLANIQIIYNIRGWGDGQWMMGSNPNNH